MNALKLYEIANKVDPIGNTEPYGILRILSQYDARITEYDIRFDGNEYIKKKEVHYYDIEGGGKYCWDLSTLWFKDTPIAIIQSAGRYGESHGEIYVTNEKIMDEAMDYLYTLNKSEDGEVVNPMIVDENEDLPQLTDFYDYKLEYFYDEDIELLHKVGDVIEVEIKDETHCYGFVDEEDSKSKRKVKIVRVDETNPSFTYMFYELERKRLEAYKYNGMVDIEDEEEIEEPFRIHGWLTCELSHIK